MKICSFSVYAIFTRCSVCTIFYCLGMGTGFIHDRNSRSITIFRYGCCRRISVFTFCSIFTSIAIYTDNPFLCKFSSTIRIQNLFIIPHILIRSGKIRNVLTPYGRHGIFQSRQCIIFSNLPNTITSGSNLTIHANNTRFSCIRYRVVGIFCNFIIP